MGWGITAYSTVWFCSFCLHSSVFKYSFHMGFLFDIFGGGGIER